MICCQNCTFFLLNYNIKTAFDDLIMSFVSPERSHCFRSTLRSLRNCDLFALCFTEIYSTEYIQTHFPQIIGSIKCKENQNTVQQWYKTIYYYYFKACMYRSALMAPMCPYYLR